MVEPLRQRRTKGAATDMFEPKATASHLDSTLFGRGVRAARCQLFGVERTSFRKTPMSESDPMYGPAVRCKSFVDLVVSGLASMYPVSSWSCFAPDHHGYQRACVLISGQASIGPFGSPVFACAGKTEPPSRLIFSQTSAGNC